MITNNEILEDINNIHEKIKILANPRNNKKDCLFWLKIYDQIKQIKALLIEHF